MLDIRGLTVIADYFVITTVSSTTQMRAVRDVLDREVAKLVDRNPRIEGEGGACGTYSTTEGSA